MKPFSLARIPRTHFGTGSFVRVFDIIQNEGIKSLLVITGGSSFAKSEHYAALMERLNNMKIETVVARVHREPSPEIVDDITAQARQKGVEAVLAIGGGSVLDAGKAVSAMVKASGSVLDYLEGVGTRQPDGTKLPMIAVPTTSGTGSEATKNAVISKVGEKGFKKSLRHDNFVPDYAILDAALSLNCPVGVTAASGMDALNQLVEGYMSEKSNDFTESLAISGIKKVFGSLDKLCNECPDNDELRGEMSYAAYLSGIVLANAGLGYVHGFAGAIGGIADVPHGVVCGLLNAGVFNILAEKIAEDPCKYSKAFDKLMTLASALGVEDSGDNRKIERLIDKFITLENRLKLPDLKSYGVTREQIRQAVSKTSGKESPVKISEEELMELVLSKL